MVYYVAQITTCLRQKLQPTVADQVGRVTSA